MDDRWETDVLEYEAMNITGFRIVDTTKRHVREFMEGWKQHVTAAATANPRCNPSSISVRHTYLTYKMHVHVKRTCDMFQYRRWWLIFLLLCEKSWFKVGFVVTSNF